MNIENLAIDNQETRNTQQSADSTVEPTTEITPLGFEFLRLVGGGGGAIAE
jgi:hypothetical protein